MKGFSTMGMAFGFKLHALTNLEGLFERWAFAAANQADVTRSSDEAALVRSWLARELTDSKSPSLASRIELQHSGEVTDPSGGSGEDVLVAHPYPESPSLGPTLNAGEPQDRCLQSAPFGGVIRVANDVIEKVKGGPAFRDSASDYLLQMADLIAHALLKQEEEPSPKVDGCLGVAGRLSRSWVAPSTAGRPGEAHRAWSGGRRSLTSPSGGYPPRRPAFRASHAALSCRGLGSGAPSRFRSPSSG